MSEFKWTYYSPNTEIWWDDTHLPTIGDRPMHHSLPTYRYHRADGPFVKVAGFRHLLAGSEYVWWYEGSYYGSDLMKYLEKNTELSDEEKALLILEFA